MKKFELTSEFVTNIFGTKLFRIKALIAFGNVEAGELGGYIEKEKNLDQSGNAWVYGDARVYGDAWVSGNARVSGNAWVSGNARVYGDAWVSGNAWVYGDARVYGDAWVSGNAEVSKQSDYAVIQGFGSCFRATTFFRTKEKEVKVACGCFLGTIAEFKKKVQETHGDGKYAKEYLAIAAAMEIHFEMEQE